MTKIKKINQLKIVESFLQADVYKGFEYVDKAGELVNNFYKNYTPPNFKMNLDGLTIQNPDHKVQEIKITPVCLWSHLIASDSFEQSSQLFSKYLNIVNRILRPEGYLRLGWRNYFVYEFIQSKEKENVFSKYKPTKDFEFIQTSFSVKKNGINMSIVLNPANKKDSPNTFAVIIDVDSYIKHDKPISYDQLLKDISKIKDFFSSNEILELFNLILKE